MLNDLKTYFEYCGMHNNYFELLFLGLYPPKSDHLDLYTSCIWIIILRMVFLLIFYY